MNIINP